MSKNNLSASKIKTFHDCSQRYFATYHLKLPETNNTGAQKGSVVHDILEILLNKRHKHHVEKALTEKTCKTNPALWRLVRKFAAKNEVDDPKELKIIDKFIIVGLGYEFYGPPGTELILGEKKFEISVDQDGKRYNIKGFIDKTFIINENNEKRIEVIDYKSSKKKYEGDDEESNIQSQMYQLALKHLYPDIKKRQFDFLFLKFEDDPIQKQPSLSDEQLEGLEYYLTYLQEQIDSFKEENARDDLAAFDADRKWLCGAEGIKKDGTPKFICPYRRPMNYWVLLDKDDKILQSSFLNDITPKDDQRIEERFYSGCPYFYNEQGKSRTLNFN